MDKANIQVHEITHNTQCGNTNLCNIQFGNLIKDLKSFLDKVTN
jgi:hypothetical protein